MRVMFENCIGYIYFIQIEHSGPIKIGIAKDVEARLGHLQSANPYKLHLLYCFPGGVKTKEGLHRLLRKDHIRGEWFWPTEKVFFEIQQQRNIDAKEKWDWLEKDPAKDLVDERLGSEHWEQKDQESKIDRWTKILNKDEIEVARKNVTFAEL